MIRGPILQLFRGLNTARHIFPVLKSTFDASSEQAAYNRDSNLPHYHHALDTRAHVLSAGRKKPSRGEQEQKLSVYERIELLQDAGSSLLLLSITAGLSVPYGSVVTGGTVTGLVRIAGELCVVSANDWTIKGGTVYPITLKKQLRAQEVAMRNRLPFIFLVDSGGAFLPLQVWLQDRYRSNYVVLLRKLGVGKQDNCISCVYYCTHLLLA